MTARNRFTDHRQLGWQGGGAGCENRVPSGDASSSPILPRFFYLFGYGVLILLAQVM